VSRRDELAAVIGEAAALSLVESEWVADAVLAWFGEQLGDEGLREALTEAIGRSHEAGRAKSELETFGAYDRRRAREDTSAALRQVREWFGVSE
jgi:hypothetical protein